MVTTRWQKRLLWAASCAAAIGTGVRPGRAETPEWVATTGTVLKKSALKMQDVLSGHLKIGVDYLYVDLQDDDRGINDSFLGSITKLKERQPDTLLWPFLQWNVTDYFGAEVRWFSLEAKTITYWDGHSDGSFELEGPVYAIYGRYPNRTLFTPSVGFGMTVLDVRFSHNPVWHNGFGGENRDQNYANWVAAGRPSWPNGGYRRTLSPEDTVGVVVRAAVEATFFEYVSAWVSAQYMETDVETRYTLSWYGEVRDDRGTFTFPMDSLSYGFGVSVNF